MPGAALPACGQRNCERARPGLDEPGGAADIGAHQFVDPGWCGIAVQVLAQALGLDVPQPEQGPAAICGSGSPALIPVRTAKVSAATDTNWSIMSAW